jgi:pyruvate/2-oxoglutarate dehydrogenase complex dihydrolipoamide acyltransferase (E2) component
MRRLGAFLLCLGLAAPALADARTTPPTAPAEETSVPWYRWLFLGERAKPATAKPAVANKDVEKGPVSSAASPGKDPAVRTMAEEHRLFLERLKAIDKIRRIANEQGDDELLKKTYDLEAQAEEVFKQRTAKLAAERDDKAILERGRDDRPATADRSTPPRRNTRGDRR